MRRVIVLLCVLGALTLPAARADTPYPARVLSETLSINPQAVRYLSTAQRDAHYGNIRSLGIKTIREGINWRLVEGVAPNPIDGHRYCWAGDRPWCTWDPGGYDKWFRDLARNGLRVDVLLGQTPDWASGRTGKPWAPPLADTDWSAFAKAVAQRYGRNGTFWAAEAAAGRPVMPVLKYEIWNEQSLTYFWEIGNTPCPTHVTPDTGPARYTTMFTSAAAAIRQADAQASVIIGGLTSWPTPQPDACGYREYLEGMKAIDPRVFSADPNVVQRASGVGFHIYAATVTDVLDQLRDFRAFVDGATVGASHLPIHLNENGWTSGHPSSVVTDEQRGLNLAETADRVTRSNCGVRNYAVHTWHTSDTGSSYHDYYGIALADGTPKGSAVAYGEAVKRLQGEGTSAANPATDIVCPGRPLPDIDGDGFVDEQDAYPADPARH